MVDHNNSEEAFEDWLERASGQNLSEEDYQRVLEELPSDPELREEWVGELKVALALEMSREKKDAQWVRGVLNQVPRNQKRSIPFLLKSLAAVALLGLALTVLNQTGVFESENEVALTMALKETEDDLSSASFYHEKKGSTSELDDIEAVEDFAQKEEGFSEDSQMKGQGKLGKRMALRRREMAFRENIEYENGFAAAPLEKVDLGRQSLAKVDDGSAVEMPSLIGGVALDSVEQIRAPSEELMEEVTIEAEEAVLATAVREGMSLEKLVGDPFYIEKKKKKRTMLANLGKGFSSDRVGRNVSRGEVGKVPFKSFTKVSQSVSSVPSLPVEDSTYSSIREQIIRHQLPSADEVRVEELINHFADGDRREKNDEALSLKMELAISAWNENHHLMKIDVNGKSDGERKPANLVFLLDVSTSMALSGRWEKVRSSLGSLWSALNAKDRISLLTFGGGGKARLSHRKGSDKATLEAFVENLSLGEQGPRDENMMKTAFDLVAANKMNEGVNRVVLVTDGAESSVFSNEEGLGEMVEDRARAGLHLSVMNLGQASSGESQLRALAKRGGGTFSSVDDAVSGREVMARALGVDSLDIAHDVKAEIVFNPDVVDAYRLVGFERGQGVELSDIEGPSGDGVITMGQGTTLLYEIIPKKDAQSGESVCSLKVEFRNEMGKAGIVKKSLPWEESSIKSTDFQWAEVVALWGRKLQGHPSVEKFPVSFLIELGRESLGEDSFGHREEMLLLVQAWDELRQGKDPRRLPMLQFWKEENSK